jgi:ABC-type transport system involved in cytochrome bd biosynthesis fused ATPase/permease subunit
MSSVAAPATGTRLAAHGLTVWRGDRRVLDAVDLQVPPDAVTALLGPSGAGKTSLLRTLVLLETPAAGRVDLDGRDVRELDPRVLRRRVGLVAQRPVMLPGTVAANLALGLVDPQPRRLAHALRATGLEPEAFLGRTAAELSGEAARVAVARALVRDPGALLLDEPTAGLDHRAAAAVEALIVRLAARGITVLVVTHDEAQARRVSTRAVRLRDGRIETR